MVIYFIDTAHPSLMQSLLDAGHKCVDCTKMSRTEILNTINNCDGVIIRSRITIDKEFIDKATALKFIGRVGAGMESIDVDYAESRGTKCFSSPEGNRDAVGEHALGMLLMLLNHLHLASHQVREGLWLREENRSIELAGKTVGLIGYGNMGSAFAERLSGFKVNILAYDKYKKDFSTRNVQEVHMDRIFNEADVLSLHVPLTEETEFLIDSSFINKFRKSIYIINTARGKVVKTKDLVAGLKSGKILGACLDVNEYEETSFEVLKKQNASAADIDVWNYLINASNVVLTPHVAGWSDQSPVKMAKILSDKILSSF